MRKTLPFGRAGAALAVCALLAPSAAFAHTNARPGFNLFSEQQDVEIGQQSAAQAERQLQILPDRYAESYVNQLVRRLAAGAPGARYPYQARIVNSPEINAFSLPGLSLIHI